MNEEKSKERLTSEAGTAGFPEGHDVVVGERADQRRSVRPAKSEVVTVRMTTEIRNDLVYIAQEL